MNNQNKAIEYTNNLTLQKLIEDCEERLISANNYGDIPETVSVSIELNMLEGIRDRYINMFTV
ncbi:MAG: hypothetical protein K5868_06430 [Lachnospiraceae bacterium]|nr:hypothetical protein [Lachnospiraceae bacterium]